MTSATRAAVNDAVKAAMKAQDRPRLDALRLLSAAFKQVEVDERIELDEARALAIIDKQAKQRRESIAAYRQAGRDDLASREEAELQVFLEFMPAALDLAEIDRLITTAIAETGATTARDMGRVLNVLRPLLTGRADMAAVSQRVKESLS